MIWRFRDCLARYKFTYLLTSLLLLLLLVIMMMMMMMIMVRHLFNLRSSHCAVSTSPRKHFEVLTRSNERQLDNRHYLQIQSYLRWGVIAVDVKMILVIWALGVAAANLT